jgi:hypothetical protein
MTNLKFFYNGIKDNSGQLHKCYYSKGAHRHNPEGRIKIYSREYISFSVGIQAAFEVEENDCICVEHSHPLYGQVKAAYDKKETRNKIKYAKRAQKKYAYLTSN